MLVSLRMTADGVAVERLRPIAHRVLLRMLILHARGGYSLRETKVPHLKSVASKASNPGIKKGGLTKQG